MKYKTKILSVLVLLLCAVVQGAWAQASWEAVYAMTQTTSADWTALDAGSSTGRTLGTAGTTTYYYAAGNLSFTNSNAGGSGLTITGTVYLYVPEGVTVTCTGANANGQTGGGAGIELTSGNTLYLIGQGTVNATGGNAANGGNGGRGGDATGYDGDWTKTGAGGNGGNGGGGAGAGIGTRGGAGGNGGSGGSSQDDDCSHEISGTNGTAGSAGATAGAMGNLYVVTSFVNLSVTGGNAGSPGSGGGRGRGYAWDGTGNNYTVAGGGGGGAGGFGGAASNIGTGGPGGGGGGGGAGGAQDKRANSKGGVYDVTAYGGKGGKNADGTSAADGAEAPTTGTACNEGWVTVENGGFGSDWNPASGAVTFGNGGSGGCGNASTAGSIKRLLATDASGNYIIYNAADWDGLSALVAEGNTFNGKTVKLTVDISVSAMVGSSRTNSFRGTFDGQGHTLTFTIGTASDRYYDDYCALFCYVNGATIQNLKVTGHIYYRGRFAGGLVAYSDGTTTITNCHVATVIHDNAIWTTGFDGGLVAWQYGPLSIMGCTFTGRLLTANYSCLCGGFVCWSNNNAISITHSLYAPDTNIPLAADENDYVDGYTFVQADNPTITNSYYTQTIRASQQGTKAYVLTSAPDNLGSLVQDYGMMKAYENGLLYEGKYYVPPANIDLADTGTNDVDGIDGYFANVTLAGRTLYRDGDWNTLCLPFNVVLDGSALEGAVARPLSEASISGTTLNLTFGDGVTTLQAGTPYIIKWEKAADYEDDAEHNIVAPVFSGVTIDATMRPYDSGDADGDKRVRFLGTYASRSFGKEDKSILFMGAENTLYYPLSGASIGAQRAYFKIGEGDDDQARQLTAFSIDFFDEQSGEAERGAESTGIVSISKESGSQGAASGWYTLDGRRLQGKPSRAGVYIYKGLKRVVK